MQKALFFRAFHGKTFKSLGYQKVLEIFVSGVMSFESLISDKAFDEKTSQHKSFSSIFTLLRASDQNFYYF